LEAAWASLADDLSTDPDLTADASLKLYKLAKELKRLESLMTAGRDLNDIQTTLYLGSV
jgi:hypothetical protein